jgi:hypothetical protein
MAQFVFREASRVRNATACESFAAGVRVVSPPPQRSRKLDAARRRFWPACRRSALPCSTNDTTTRSIFMLILSYAYRVLSNFVFLALVYLALNFLDKYQHRVVVAVLVLIYAAMHAASALRSFHFFQRIERLELEVRRLLAAIGEGMSLPSARKQIVTDVTALRHAGEIKAYIDLLFLAIVLLLCIAKIVAN